MEITVLQDEVADELRTIYIDTFIESECEYYKLMIETQSVFSDGKCYCGYLWDCLKQKNVASIQKCTNFLSDIKNPIYVFWDIHSADRILIPNYWIYPKKAVLQLMPQIFLKIQAHLPEDIYIFDDSLTWTIVLTHEESKPGRRICFFIE